MTCNVCAVNIKAEASSKVCGLECNNVFGSHTYIVNPNPKRGLLRRDGWELYCIPEMPCINV